LRIGLDPASALFSSEQERDGLLALRLLAFFLAVFLLAACNEVTGDSTGGVIEHFGMRPDGPGPYDAYLPQLLLDFRDKNALTSSELLQIADSHCTLYGKRAAINKIGQGKIYFDGM
jgi:hypothetical protein